MDCKNLFTKNRYFEDEELRQYSNLQEELKKKPEKARKNQRVINASSELVFVKFYFKGKIIALFEEIPVEEDVENPIQILYYKDVSPLQIIYTKDITRITTKLEGKPGFFRIEIGKNKWELKSNIKNKWIASISFLSKLYKDDKDFITREYSDNLDLKIINRIKAENDVINWKDKWENFDYTNFIKAKDLALLFELNLFITLKNRLLISKIKANTFIRTDKDKSNLKSALTVTTELQSEMSFSDTAEIFIVILGQTALSNIDEVFYQEDFAILTRSTVVPWINFNVIYFFNYFGIGDDSHFFLAYSIDEIEYLLFENEGKDLKLQLLDRILLFSFNTHLESFLWANAINKAIHFNLIEKRSLKNNLSFNVELIYEFLSYNKKEKIQESLLKLLNNLNWRLDIGAFSGCFKIVVSAVENFIDAFYSRVPFNTSFFNYCMVTLHVKIRSAVNQFWNKNFDNFNALEAIDFAGLFSGYVQMLEKWNILDDYLSNWEVSFIETFIFHLYEKVKGILFNILVLTTEQVVEKEGKMLNSSSEMIESQMNSIFDNYKKISNEKTAIILIESSSKFFITFLRNMMFFLNRVTYEIDIYIAILNNKYMAILRSFMKKVYRDLKKSLSMDKIKALVREPAINSLIINLEQFCFEKLKRTFYGKIDESFKKQSFLSLNLNDFIHMNLIYINDIIQKLNSVNSGRFYIDFLKKIIAIYFKNFIDFISTLKPDDYMPLINKLPADKKLFMEFVARFKVDNRDEFEFIFENLLKLVQTKDIDEVNIILMNFHIFYSELITEETVDKIVQCKIFFPKSSKQYIIKYLKKSLIQFGNLTEAKKKLGKAFYVVYLVLTFIKNLKKGAKVRKAMMKGIINKALTVDPSLTVNGPRKPKKAKYENSTPSFESIYQTQGWVELFKFNPNHSVSKLDVYLKEKIQKKTGWKKHYCFFNIGALTITEDSQHKKVIMSVLYANVEYVKMLNKTSFYFKEKNFGIAFNFVNTNKELASVFLKSLSILSECFSGKKIQPQKIELTEYLTKLIWKRTLPNFSFDFEFYRQLDEAKIVEIEFESGLYESQTEEQIEGDNKHS